jgi:hypothetical protein
MLPDLSGNNRVPWPCAQKRWIRSVFALAQIKANPRDAIPGTLCRAAQGRPYQPQRPQNAHNPIARCAHGRAQGLVTAAQVDAPPRACLSQDSKAARLPLGTGMGRLAMTPSIVPGLARGDRAEQAKTAWRPMDPGPSQPHQGSRKPSGRAMVAEKPRMPRSLWR